MQHTSHLKYGKYCVTQLSGLNHEVCSGCSNILVYTADTIFRVKVRQNKEVNSGNSSEVMVHGAIQCKAEFKDHVVEPYSNSNICPNVGMA
jgi:hypothetical protein